MPIESKILIPINRRTIQQLEKAIDKHNKENQYNVNDYPDMINKLLEEYLKK
jgi:hypothetical protein